MLEFHTSQQILLEMFVTNRTNHFRVYLRYVDKFQRAMLHCFYDYRKDLTKDNMHQFKQIQPICFSEMEII